MLKRNTSAGTAALFISSKSGPKCYTLPLSGTMRRLLRYSVPPQVLVTTVPSMVTKVTIVPTIKPSATIYIDQVVRSVPGYTRYPPQPKLVTSCRCDASSLLAEI